jgi:hypothetical protein
MDFLSQRIPFVSFFYEHLNHLRDVTEHRKYVELQKKPDKGHIPVAHEAMVRKYSVYFKKY